MNKPKIVLSSCLLGNNVRYDGGNTEDSWITKKLSRFFELKAICPELAMGMSVPREPVNIILEKDGTKKMIGVNSHTDHTSNAVVTSQNILKTEFNEVSGVILQKKSPSCGLERVKLYNEKHEHMFQLKHSPQNRGLFADELLKRFPLLPAIDSGRIFDRDERENFIRRVVAYERFQRLDKKISSLQDFHARYKFVIMEYHQDVMRKLGKLAANSAQLSADVVYQQYEEIFFNAMTKIPTRKSRTNVFFHLLGFFKQELSPIEKEIIIKMIDDYNKNLLPYAVPYKMIEFLILKHQQYYLKNHYYLDQFPKELLEEK